MEKKLSNIAWTTACIALVFFVGVKSTYAQSYLGSEWNKFLGGVGTFTGAGNKTGEELAKNFILNGIVIVRFVVGAVAVIMGILYGMSLVFARGQEDVITKQKKNFLGVLIGFIILIISENVARIFNPEIATAQKMIDFGAARDQLRSITDYLKWLLGSIAVLSTTISGISLVIAAGDEEAVTKQKRNLTWSLIGMLVILLANNIVNAIYVIKTPSEVVAGSPQSSITEISSIIRLILVFLGPIAIAFTIYAGFYYLTSFDNEERTTKAKNMIVGGVTGIIIIYSAVAIVNTLTSKNLAPPEPTAYLLEQTLS